METFYKVFDSIISAWINLIVRDGGLEEQYESLNIKGYTDTIFALKTALQIRREHRQRTHVLFVDLVKAFDTINHEFLMKVLTKYGMSKTLVDIITWIYVGFELQLSVGSTEKKIPYTIGVHQEDNLAPILFNLFFQAAVKSFGVLWERTITTPEFH